MFGFDVTRGRSPLGAWNPRGLGEGVWACLFVCVMQKQMFICALASLSVCGTETRFPQDALFRSQHSVGNSNKNDKDVKEKLKRRATPPKRKEKERMIRRKSIRNSDTYLIRKTNGKWFLQESEHLDVLLFKEDYFPRHKKFVSPF